MRLLRILVLLIFLLMLPLFVLGEETPWGKVRVLGYEDDRSTCNGKFAPIAILTSKAHVSDMYLRYRYCKFDSETRVWQLKLVDEDEETYKYSGLIDIIFPYPEKWSSKEKAYWKWTQSYADRYDWSLALGYSEFAYKLCGKKYCVAGYFIGNPTLRNKSGTDVKKKFTKDENGKKTALLFPFENSSGRFFMKDLKLKPIGGNFYQIDPNDSYGHRISFRPVSGTFPSVCIKIYTTKPSFNECRIKEKFTFLGYSIWKTYYFDGFITDTRPKKYKYKPRFRLFLKRNVSTL